MSENNTTSPASAGTAPGGCRPSADFFVSNAKNWNLEWDVVREPLPPATVREVPDAVVLPLRVRKDPTTSHHLFEGGLCEADGTFVAGRRRSLKDDKANFSALWSYPFDPATLEVRDEEVVFAGVLFDHYGHLLTDSTSRLWYVFAHPEKTCKIVFVRSPRKARWAPEDPMPLFEMAGIDPARIEIVEKPTRFRNAIVPEEAVYSLDAFRPEWISFFDAVRAHIEPSPHRKVYFSRTHFKRNDVHNEDLFESYWKDLGFHIVHPEDFTLREEISFAAGADEIVATIGTLSHQFLFCKPGTRATVLLRTSNVVPLQLIVGAARGLRSDYVEAFRNPLPTWHSDGVFYLAPVPRFRGYLEKRGLPGFGRERLSDAYTEARVRPYVKKWLEVFGNRSAVLHRSASAEIRAMGDVADRAKALGGSEEGKKLYEGLVASVGAKLFALQAAEGRSRPPARRQSLPRRLFAAAAALPRFVLSRVLRRKRRESAREG
jgi:hypothetical protein